MKLISYFHDKQGHVSGVSGSPNACGAPGGRGAAAGHQGLFSDGGPPFTVPSIEF